MVYVEGLIELTVSQFVGDSMRLPDLASVLHTPVAIRSMGTYPPKAVTFRLSSLKKSL